MELSPALILALWTGGIGAGAALVAFWDVVGPGFLWVSAGTVVLFGALAVVAGGGTGAIAGIVFAVVAAAVARRRIPAVVAFAAAAASFALVALRGSSPLLVLTGLAAFGGITTEMLLGHWFLVDPRLPRRPLRILSVLGGSAMALDLVVSWLLARPSFSGPDGVLAMAFAVLGPFTVLLMVGVRRALDEPGYSGVMAATGLSYLAVLTSLGAVTLGRILVAGS